MGFRDTNREITTHATRQQHVQEKIISKHLAWKAKKKHNRRLGMMKKGFLKIAKCTKCQRGMDGHLAKLQIQNKREDAPICIPCIMGIKRKPLPDFKKTK